MLIIENIFEKKKEILFKNFDILKDNYDKNGSSLSSIVVKMFKIDVDTAVDMWSYLVTKYAPKVKDEYNSCYLTTTIIYDGGMAIGEEEMEEIVINNQVLKNALFSQAGCDVGLYLSDAIRRKINKNQLQIADELLSLIYKNKYTSNSWYEIMNYVIPDDADEMEVTEEAYELLEMWCNKVKDKEERASLSVKMMEFMY